MSKIINKDRKYVILNPDKILSKLELDKFNNLILERAKGKPVAYLTGRKFFGSMNLMFQRMFLFQDQKQNLF